MKQYPSLNPYRYAIRQLRDAAGWDLSPAAWGNRGKLKRLRDSQSRKKAVILCNGPSLLKADFELLKSVHTFGLNKVNLLFDSVDFRPSAIVSVNRLVIEQSADFYNSTGIPLFVSARHRKPIKSRPNVHFLYPIRWDRVMGDITWGVVEGYTVTCVALQIAFHMGFQSVALVGCDHNFSRKGDANAEEVAEGKDPDHFHPDYFANVKWHLPDLPACEYFYYRCGEMYQRANRRIVNCTEGGKLDMFPRESLSEFLKH